MPEAAHAYVSVIREKISGGVRWIGAEHRKTIREKCLPQHAPDHANCSRTTASWRAGANGTMMDLSQ
jgi:hypothetical protein